MIVFTDAAKDQLVSILAEQKQKSHVLLSVKGGGCSGFSYQMQIVEGDIPEDALPVELATDFMLGVDLISSSYMEGMTVDYVTDGFNRHFAYMNPNATSTCGCGSSFAA